MSFSAADLVATIQLGGVDTAGRDLDKFRAKLNDTDSVASKIGKTAEATFRGTATAIGVAGTAAAIYAAKLLSTGVAYNQLQQTSRAALRTLMGGAEQANAQMDKLDAFARNSPFSKSVFISAQQQLIGFGFEAQKVIPILDAVQNSVAAVGGSNQQISEIVSILAKIRSSQKLTGEDFNMLGERGLDAATLIGQGFGKSAAEIRESVTKGTLDAGEAIDVLVSQMGTKFAGAASNVKETFAGTKDRIAAASRDIGSALAEPFVSKNGGGLAVVWGNQVADVMRAVESHTTPVVSMLMTRAMPAFAGITTTLEQARVQVRSWDSSRLENGLDAISEHGPGFAALAGSILGVNSQLLASLPIVGRFVPAFGPLGGAIAGAALASPQLRKELGALLGELKPLLPVTVNLASTMSGTLNAALPIVASGVRAVVAVAGPLADVLEKIPSPMLATAVAGIAVFAALRGGAPAIQGFVDGVRRIGEQAAVQAALAGMEGNTSRLSGTFGVAGKAATGLGNSLKAAFVSNPVGLIILGVSTAAMILTAALTKQAEQAQKTRDRIQGYRDTLTEAGDTTAATVDKIRESIKDFATVDTDIFSSGKLTSAKDWVESVGGAEQALLRFGVTSGTIADAVRDGGSSYDLLLDSLTKYGTETERIKTTGGMKDQLTDSANAANLLKGSIVEQRQAVEIAAQVQADYNQRQREAAAAMSETERSNVRLNEAIAIARDVSRDATERLRALKQALDELNGGTKTQADQTRDLNEQTNRLREAFAATDDAGNKLAPSLVNAAGAIDTTTSAGIRLYDETKRLNDQMLDAILNEDKLAKARGDAGISTERAAQVAQPYIDQLRAIAAESGIGAEQVDGLVRSMLDTPSVIAFLVTDNGTIDVQKQQMLVLAQQIIDTPNGEFEVDTPSIPGLMDALSALGVKTQTLPNGTVRVFKDDGSFATVYDALAKIPRDIRVNVSSYYGGGTNVNPDIPGFKRAGGGPVFGPGTSTSDSIPALLSNDEHVLPAAEVHAAGGHSGIMRIRRAIRDHSIDIPRFAEGGPVYPLRAGTDPLVRVASPFGARQMAESSALIEAMMAQIQSLRNAGTAPLVGSLTVQSTGDVKEDMEEVVFYLRTIERGGRR